MENPIQTQVKNPEFSVLLQKDETPNGAENLMDFDTGGEKGGYNKEDEIYKMIVYQLEVKKIYLDPQLSLVKFSSIVGTNTTYLSNTVNRRFGMNLKALVNRYRVGHAKRLMNEGRYRYEELAGLCGFTSRSVFYSSFKRELAMSPKRYVLTKLKTIK